MRRNRGGFTIIEVMIFLVISGAMLAAAMVAIKGQQNRTEFTQGMRDLDSKLQDVLNDVSTGNFSYNDERCMIVGSDSNARPQFTGVTGQQIGSRSECLFLGEALQFSTQGSDNSRFAIYTVLGRRLMDGGTPGNSVSVNSFDQAHPTVMNNPAHGLTTYYSYEQGITATHIYYTPNAGGSITDGDYSLLGIYTGFTSAAGNVGNSGADASQSLQAYTYKLADGTGFDTMGPSSAKNCIDSNDSTGASGGCPYDKTLSTNGSKGLGICFDSNNGTGQTALITIYNTAQGVSTRLEYNPAGICPAS